MVETGPVPAMLASSPAVRSGSVDHGGWWTLTIGGVLNIYGDLPEEECERIGRHERVTQVQISAPYDPTVSRQTWLALDKHVFATHPSACLRYGWLAADLYGPVDLGFLEDLPSLRVLSVEGRRLDLAPVARQGRISHLGVGSGGVSLDPIAGMTSIRSLWLRDGVKNWDVVSGLENLEAFGFTGVTVKDLSVLEPLERLWSLAISFGGTRCFSELLRLRHLRRVDIMRVRQVEMSDLHPLSHLENLQTLGLRELPRVTDLAWLTSTSLRDLELDLKNLASVASLAGLQGLVNLALHRPDATTAVALLPPLPALRTVYGYRVTPAPSSAPFDLRDIDFAPGQFMYTAPAP